MKTPRIIKKRFKVTKTKKVMHRSCGQNHFRSRKTGTAILQKRQSKNLSKSFQKTVRSNFK